MAYSSRTASLSELLAAIANEADGTTYSAKSTSQNDLLAAIANGFVQPLASLTPQTVVSTDPDFTVVLLPDTQKMVANIPATWRAIPTWIAANKTTLNIKAVISLGDVVDDATIAQQFVDAKAGWDDLLATGIPSFIGIGNHDYDTSAIGATRPFTLFPATFPLSYMSGQSWYGGAYGATLESWWGTFTAGSTTYLVIMLETFARDAVLTWAQGVIDAHPGVPTMVMSHSHISASGRRTRANDTWGRDTYGLSTNGNDADGVWTKFIKLNSQIFMVFGGHIIPTPAVAWFPDVSDDNTIVHQLLINHQGDANSGTGNIGLLKFRPSLGVIEMTDYSVGTDSLYTPGTFRMPFASPRVDTDFTAAGSLASTKPAVVGKLRSLGDVDIVGGLTAVNPAYFGTLPADSAPQRAQLEATDPDTTQIMHLRLGARFSHIGLGNYHITNAARYHASGWLHDGTSVVNKLTLNSDGSFAYSYGASAADGQPVTWADRLTISVGGLVSIAPAASLASGDYLAMNAGRFHFIGVTGFNMANNASYDGSNYKYVSTTTTQRLSLTAAGAMEYYNAASGTAGNNITYTLRFSIGPAGEVLTTPKTPASASATGTAGQIAVDANYVYVCTATDTWKRVAVTTW